MPLPADILDDIDEEREAIRAALGDAPPIPGDIGPVPSIANNPPSGPIVSRRPLAATPGGQQRFVDAPTTEEAYRELPQSAAPRQVPTEIVPSQGRPFDWGRALTSFSGGDVGAYDARQRYRESAPQRQAEFEDAQFQRQQARALIDPTSQQSRDAQQNFASFVQGAADNPAFSRFPKIQEMLKQQAAGAWNKSAAQVASVEKAIPSYLGDLLKGVGEDNRAALSDETMDL